MCTQLPAGDSVNYIPLKPEQLVWWLLGVWPLACWYLALRWSWEEPWKMIVQMWLFLCPFLCMLHSYGLFCWLRIIVLFACLLSEKVCSCFSFLIWLSFCWLVVWLIVLLGRLVHLLVGCVCVCLLTCDWVDCIILSLSTALLVLWSDVISISCLWSCLANCFSMSVERIIEDTGTVKVKKFTYSSNFYSYSQQVCMQYCYIIILMWI